MKIKLFTIPNLITLGNLFCGSVGSVLTVAHICGENYSLALPFYLMLGSALLDFCDGFAARLLHQYSEVGKELDSLADVVSFGLLPSLLFMALFLEMGGAPAWSLMVLIVVLFSALRLAKFNIDTTQTDSFVGLPTPACALFVGSLAWHVAEKGAAINPWVILALAVVFAILLLVPLRMFSLKFHGFAPKGINLLRYSFLALSALLIVLCGLSAVAWIIILYIATSIVMSLTCKGKN